MKTFVSKAFKYVIEKIYNKPEFRRNWRKSIGYDLPICSDIIVPIDDPLNEKLSHDSLLEGSAYENIPGTRRYARKDKGQPITGKEWHIHVFARSQRGECVYAINADATPHDGSKSYIGSDDCKYLRSKGINVPEGGFQLEWRTPESLSLLLQD